MQSIHFDSILSYDTDGKPVYDRPNSAEMVRRVFKSFIGNGVSINPSNSFKVLPADGMNVFVQPGNIWIEGSYGYEPDIRTLAVQPSTELDRIDRVVARLDLTMPKRDIDLYVLYGVPASIPTAPTLTRNDTIFELGLADIFVSKNSTGITEARVQDLRGFTEYCGFVHAVFEQADLTDIFSQYQSYLNEQIAYWNETKEQQAEEWLTQLLQQKADFDTLQTDINAWYNEVKSDINKRQAISFEDIATMVGVRTTSINGTDTASLIEGGRILATMESTEDSEYFSDLFTIFDDDGTTILRKTLYKTNKTTFEMQVTGVA